MSRKPAAEIADGFEWKLRGSPWGQRDNGDDSARGRLLLLNLINSLEQIGYSVLTVADVSSRTNEDDDGNQVGDDLDTIFFSRTQ
jgi:hypothetical protein